MAERSLDLKISVDSGTSRRMMLKRPFVTVRQSIPVPGGVSGQKVSATASWY